MKFITALILLLPASCLTAEEIIPANSIMKKAQVDFEAICFFVGIILILLGLTKGIPAYFEWRRDKKLLLTGTETTGIINEAWLAMSGEAGENSGSYCLSAEFKTTDNLTYQAIAPFVVNSHRKLLNTDITIIYDPKDPEHAKFKNEIHLNRRFLVFILYLLMCISGMGLFLYLFFTV